MRGVLLVNYKLMEKDVGFSHYKSMQEPGNFSVLNGIKEMACQWKWFYPFNSITAHLWPVNCLCIFDIKIFKNNPDENKK